MQYQLCSDGHCLHILKQCVTLSVIANLRLLLKTNSTPSVTETGQETRAHRLMMKRYVAKKFINWIQSFRNKSYNITKIFRNCS